jgi:hypothetical protein
VAHGSRKADDEHADSDRRKLVVRENRSENCRTHCNCERDEARLGEMRDRGDERAASEQLHLLKIDHRTAEHAACTRKAGCACEFQRGRVHDHVAEIQPVSERGAAENNQKIGLSRGRQERTHGKWCHAWAGSGNRRSTGR